MVISEIELTASIQFQKLTCFLRLESENLARDHIHHPQKTPYIPPRDRTPPQRPQHTPYIPPKTLSRQEHEECRATAAACPVTCAGALCNLAASWPGV